MEVDVPSASKRHRGASSEHHARRVRHRENRLRARLEARGLVLREDSRLCSKYIHRGKGDEDDIVDTMIEMDWFFANTDYDFYREGLYHDACSRYELIPVAKRPPFTRHYNKDSSSECAKDVALVHWMERHDVGSEFHALPTKVQQRAYHMKKHAAFEAWLAQRPWLDRGFSVSVIEAWKPEPADVFDFLSFSIKMNEKHVERVNGIIEDVTRQQQQQQQLQQLQQDSQLQQ